MAKTFEEWERTAQEDFERMIYAQCGREDAEKEPTDVR
jgi:hypothetical protein